MNVLQIGDDVLINEEEYEYYQKLKRSHRRSIDRFVKINVLTYRLSLFINLVIDNNEDKPEEILFNLQDAIEDLRAYCKEYEHLMNHYFEED
ncbi:MAG: hypothetical protein K2G73_09380 [Eubacterium sp.]|nr:hypothetical protein [Eubacterium sp.]